MTEMQWRDISEAPKNGTYLLFCFPAGSTNDPECSNASVGRIYERDGKVSYWLTSIWASGNAHVLPTHWQPLPAPPSDNEVKK